MFNIDTKLLKREEEGQIIRAGVIGQGQMGTGMTVEMVT